VIAQLALTALLLGIVLYARLQYKRAPLIGLLSVAVALAALYFVWIPAHATRLAEFAGIGRGVDLILYLWVVISLIVLLNLHLKLRAQMETITTLAREVALANARSATTPK